LLLNLLAQFSPLFFGSGEQEYNFFFQICSNFNFLVEIVGGGVEGLAPLYISATGMIRQWLSKINMNFVDLVGDGVGQWSREAIVRPAATTCHIQLHWVSKLYHLASNKLYLYLLLFFIDPSSYRGIYYISSVCIYTRCKWQ